jgi:hypothetical protein
MELYIYSIALIGSGTLIGVFTTKKSGFGTYTIRAMGIVLVATFVSILAVKSDACLNAAFGILGAIAGYLFSIHTDMDDKP